MIIILLCIIIILSIIGIMVINQSKHHSDKNLELLKSKMNDLTQQREQWQQFIMNQQAQQQEQRQQFDEYQIKSLKTI